MVRGDDWRSGSMFSYVDIEKKVRPDHPLRTIKTLVDEALADLSGRFARLYSSIGAPVDPAGVACAGDAPTGILPYPLGAPVDGAI